MIDQVIRELERGGWDPVESAGKYRSRCPVHRGDGRSLEISQGDKGVLSRCWASDCTVKEVSEALGLDLSVFFDEPLPRHRQKRNAVKSSVRGSQGKHKGARMGFDKPTLKRMAGRIGVTVDHLKEWGWQDGTWSFEKKSGGTAKAKGCRVPYLDANQTETLIRIRVTCEGEGPKYVPEKLGQELRLYGEHKLDEYRSRPRPEGYRGPWPYLILCEGETDPIALDFEGLPGSGIPGSSVVDAVLKKEHIEGFERVLVIREPGKAGLEFCGRVYAKLIEFAEQGTRVSAKAIEFPEDSDPAELLKQDREGFKAAFGELTRKGKPLKDVAREAELEKGKNSPIRKQARSLLIQAQDVRMKPTRYYMYPYLPAGPLTLLFGDGGIGKSSAMVKISAMGSTGQVIPGADPEKSELGDGRVLVLAKEDRPDDTLVPRYTAWGGDRSKLHIFNAGVGRDVTLKDFDLIKAMVDEVKPSLIWIDPISRFWPSGVSMTDQDSVIPLIEPISDLGHDYGAAVVLVGWSPKGAKQTAKEKIFGSVAWIGTARSALVIQEQNKSGVIHQCKVNNSAEVEQGIRYQIRDEMAALDPALASTLSEEELEAIRRVGTFDWMGLTEETADEIAAASYGSKSGSKAQRKAIDETRQHIVDLLKNQDGPVDSAVLAELRKQLDTPWHVFSEAKMLAGVVTQTGVDGGYVVSLPGGGDDVGEDDYFNIM